MVVPRRADTPVKELMGIVLTDEYKAFYALEHNNKIKDFIMTNQEKTEYVKQQILAKIAEKISADRTDELTGTSHSSGSIRSTHSNSNRVGTKSHNSSSHGAIRRH